MSRKHAQQQRLIEVSGLIATLTERMMTAYAVGTRPAETEVQAFCRGVLLLEDHGVALPPFAEAVIDRLQAEDDAPPARARTLPAMPHEAPAVAAARPVTVLDRWLRPFRAPRAEAIPLAS